MNDYWVFLAAAVFIVPLVLLAVVVLRTADRGHKQNKVRLEHDS